VMRLVFSDRPDFTREFLTGYLKHLAAVILLALEISVSKSDVQRGKYLLFAPIFGAFCFGTVTVTRVA